MSGLWLFADRLCRSVARNPLQVPLAPRRGECRHAVGECACPLRDEKTALAEDWSGGRGVVAAAIRVIQGVSQKVTSSISALLINTCRSAQEEGDCDVRSLYQQWRFLVKGSRVHF